MEPHICISCQVFRCIEMRAEWIPLKGYLNIHSKASDGCGKILQALLKHTNEKFSWQGNSNI